MANPLRWGILGSGNIAGKFAAQLPQSAQARLVAVAKCWLPLPPFPPEPPDMPPNPEIVLFSIMELFVLINANPVEVPPVPPGSPVAVEPPSSIGVVFVVIFKSEIFNESLL